MKSKNLYNQITNFIKSKNYKELSLNPVIDLKYIRNEKLKKYLFTLFFNQRSIILRFPIILRFMVFNGSLFDCSKFANPARL